MSRTKLGAFYRVFEVDKGAGSGGGTGDGPGKKSDDSNPTGNADPVKNSGDDQKAKDAAAKAKADAEALAAKKFTQEDIDRVVSERLAREKSNQEAEQLKKQGEFQKLYEETKPKLDKIELELTTVKAERDELAKSVNNQIELSIKDWPKEIKDLYDPSESLKKRQDWVEKMTPVVKRLNGVRTPINGEHGKQGAERGETRVEQGYMRGRYQGPQTTGTK